MNKVYFFYDEEGYGRYVAHKTFKEAKDIALMCPTFDMLDNPFIDIRGNLVKKVNHKTEEEYIVKTEKYFGLLDVEELNELGLLWWQCPECGDDDFEIIDGGENYKCACGYCGQTPYY
jgi:hypothetical protein